MTTSGNISLLDQPSHGFLCSRCTKSSAILPCLDWAMEMSHGSTPVMSTFHSELEVAVLDILLKGTCPLILVLGRSGYKVIPDKLKEAFDSGRVLFVSVSDQKRITKESAFKCNEYICNCASYITFGFLSPESSMYSLYNDLQSKSKTVKLLTNL